MAHFVNGDLVCPRFDNNLMMNYTIDKLMASFSFNGVI